MEILNSSIIFFILLTEFVAQKVNYESDDGTITVILENIDREAQSKAFITSAYAVLDSNNTIIQIQSDVNNKYGSLSVQE